MGTDTVTDICALTQSQRQTGTNTHTATHTHRHTDITDTHASSVFVKSCPLIILTPNMIRGLEPTTRTDMSGSGRGNAVFSGRRINLNLVRTVQEPPYLIHN